MRTEDLLDTEFDPYYGRYIYKLGEDIELRQGFDMGKQNILSFFESIPEEQWMHRYEEDKWTIKEVLQHLIDTERIFMYRCFRIARRDATPLAGFDQDIYMEPSKANAKSKAQLLKEFGTVRDGSICLLDSLSSNDLCQIGDANGNDMSARAAAFTIIGHDIWHMDIVKDKYLGES